MESGKVKVTIYISSDVNSTLKSYSAEVKKNLKSQSEVIEEALIEFFEKRNYTLKKG